MKDYKPILIIINLLLLLVYFNTSIAKKEQIIKDGKLILLELAPVDPRSLIQGDYMQLRYRISENISADSIPKRGFCIVHIDTNAVGKKIRFQELPTPIRNDEYAINYTAVDDWKINIGAESYFFQEGEAEKYEKAKYGGIKIDQKGNSVLIGLYDQGHQFIK
ncbi:GDYXXLXY domain-containing protein [Sphingobacterium sp. SGG-5]|uniref:GDYXXLXY domain-containing protein n=1 Tax=Sphingobacterium sp. SGG-5 TaxID=2710881 RepID=UPI0013EC6D61|nr:GDYXXLXY domain-containing protein [Sphingobacterium sp. SGG-5]NGM61890.1 GDYXXLXY domain-containing protein [Sphingobacterium sp. SGG-5]